MTQSVDHIYIDHGEVTIQFAAGKDGMIIIKSTLKNVQQNSNNKNTIHYQSIIDSINYDT